ARQRRPLVPAQAHPPAHLWRGQRQRGDPVLISVGCGVVIVPRIVMDKSPLAREVRALEVEPELGEFRVGVCTQRRKLQSPLVRAFWETMEEGTGARRS